MTKYVALLRGIGPTNPNMRNDKLRTVFEGLGFRNVQTVISSGNVVFESSSKSVSALESKIEKALPAQLGFNSITIIRSQAELQRLVAKDPFKGATHSRDSYLIVTFLKKKAREIYTVIDTKKSRTVDFMAQLEKQHSKEITTRTWKTIGRILAKMDSK